MKKLVSGGSVILLVLIAVPLVRYRSLDPCAMLEHELVTRAEREVRAARDSVRAATGGLGDETRRAADDVASAVGHLVVGVASGAAAAKVERMTTRECVAEMWRVVVKRD
ncbi:MAG: hypothetical protein OER21_00310 [Gemmatimonadota bacterium]|nr:hypothetical protein [Gemmatimonadota bacterium]